MDGAPGFFVSHVPNIRTLRLRSVRALGHPEFFVLLPLGLGKLKRFTERFSPAMISPVEWDR